MSYCVPKLNCKTRRDCLKYFSIIQVERSSPSFINELNMLVNKTKIQKVIKMRKSIKSEIEINEITEGCFLWLSDRIHALYKKRFYDNDEIIFTWKIQT